MLEWAQKKLTSEEKCNKILIKEKENGKRKSLKER
jgi:hypothetical protein